MDPFERKVEKKVTPLIPRTFSFWSPDDRMTHISIEIR